MNMQIFAGFRYRGECNSSLPDLALQFRMCACAGFYIAMHLGYYAEAQVEVSMVIPDDRYGVVPIGKVLHRHHLPPLSCARPYSCSWLKALSPAVTTLAVNPAANSTCK